MSIYFYTVRIDNQEFAITSSYYSYAKVAKEFGIERKDIIMRGADSKLQYYYPKKNK